MKLKRGHAELHKAQDFRSKYLKSIVYGGLDGIITTFAVVAGVAGASLGHGIVLILGFANLIADGISMAVGDYLSTKAENEYRSTEKRKESQELRRYPEEEKKELVRFYIKKGLSKLDSMKIVNILFKNKKLMLRSMLSEELNLNLNYESPTKNAIFTFISFVLFGLIPLISYLVIMFIPSFSMNTFLVACFLVSVALFLLGVAKGRISGRHWLKSGIETLIIGGLAAGAAYIIGYLLSGLA